MTPAAISEKYGSSTWWTIRPTVELAPLARVRAYGLATYPSSRAICRIRSATSALTPSRPARARDAVASETAACSATSTRRGRWLALGIRNPPKVFMPPDLLPVTFVEA